MSFSFSSVAYQVHRASEVKYLQITKGSGVYSVLCSGGNRAFSHSGIRSLGLSYLGARGGRGHKGAASPRAP